MKLLKIHLGKNSFRPFLALLNKHSLHYILGEEKASMRVDTLFVNLLQSAETWDKLPMVIIEFLDRPHRKVLITSKDGRRINAGGLAHRELGRLVANAKDIEPFETALEQTRFSAAENTPSRMRIASSVTVSTVCCPKLDSRQRNINSETVNTARS